MECHFGKKKTKMLFLWRRRLFCSFVFWRYSGFVCSWWQSQAGVAVQMLGLKSINRGAAFHRHRTLESTNSCCRYQPPHWTISLLWMVWAHSKKNTTGTVLVFGLLGEAGDPERFHPDWGRTIIHSFTLEHSQIATPLRVKYHLMSVY